MLGLRPPIGITRTRRRSVFRVLEARPNKSSELTLVDRLERALAARQVLLDDPSTNACRLFNGAADGIAGLVVEKFGDLLVVQLHGGRLKLGLDEVRSLVEQAHKQLGTRAVYKKAFVPDRSQVSRAIADGHTDAAPWIGEPAEPESVVTEYGLRFIIRPYAGFSVGLFLEHRENRRRIRELAAGRRVLNAFAYTCSFSVAAAAGGAASVSSVDLSKHHLQWGKQNFTANNVDTTGHRFFCSDIFDFYKRAERQQRRFDLILLDPPTFSRGRRPKRAFVLQEQLGQLVTRALDLLDPGGLILLATNSRQISRAQLEQELAASARAAAKRRCTILERPELPVDFAGDPDYSKTVIARID